MAGEQQIGIGDGVFEGGFSAPSYVKDFNEFLRIQKDLSAGAASIVYDGGGTGQPLMFHSVQGTLASTVFTEKHIRFWPTVPKAGDKLISTTHEYTRQTSYGEGQNFFAGEGSIGPLVDSNFERLFAKCKFMSTTRRVTHVMNLINPLIGGAKNAQEQSIVDASKWFLRQLETACFFANETVDPNAFDGIRPAIEKRAPANITDMQGTFVDTRKMYEIVVSLIQDHFTSPTTIWMDYQAKADFGLEFMPYVKYDVAPGTPGGLKINGGAEALGLNGPDGILSFQPDVFLAPQKRPTSLAAIVPTGQSTLASPVFKVQPTAGAVGEGETSVFITGDAGTYYYSIRAVGKVGTGASAIINSNSVAVIVGQKVSFTITKPDGDTVQYYEVYRTKPGGTAQWKVGEIRQTYGEGGAVADTVFTDLNGTRPDTTCMFVITPDPAIFVWQQLLDFARIPLPMTEQTGLRIPNVYCMYGMLEVQVPEKLWLIKNVARATA